MCLGELNNDNFISGGSDGSIKIWEFESRNCVETLYGHFDAVTALIIIKNNNLIINGSDDSKW